MRVLADRREAGFTAEAAHRSPPGPLSLGLPFGLSWAWVEGVPGFALDGKESNMITLVGGPVGSPLGKATGLCIRRSPIFLRITQQGKKLDALDQLYDHADPGETLYAYKLLASEGTCHINRGRHGSGFFVMARYGFIEPQPSDEIMRDNEAWSKWCHEQPEAKGSTGEG